MERSAIWAMFYSSVVGMSLHPGTTRDATPQRDMKQCAQLADDMLREFEERWNHDG